MSQALKSLLRPFRRSLISAIALQAVAGLSSLIPWIALGQIAKAGMVTDSMGFWLGVVVLFGLLWLACQSIALHITHEVDAALCQQLRLKLTTHLGRLPLGWFVYTGSDGVTAYVDHDVRSLHQLVAHAPADITQLMVVPIVAGLYLFQLNGFLALLAFIPLVSAVVLFFLMRLPTFSPDVQARDEAMAEMLSDYGQFSGNLFLVRQYPEAGVQEAVFTATARFDQAFQHWVMRVGSLSAIVQVLLSAPALTLWLILAAVLLGTQSLSAAYLCMFILLLKAIAHPLQNMGHGGDALRSAQMAAQRLEALLAIEPLKEGTRTLLPQNNDIEVKQLDYHYADTAALHQVNFTLKSGTSTAIVGPSGAGKSTLLLLLARFMDPDNGAITIGGVDIREFPLTLLYQQVATVFQQNAGLDCSLAQNMALYQPAANREAIVDAAQRACLAERIEELPRGYDTILNKEVAFSGGELQRLALARAFLAPAHLLLLDEPTAALDPQTERLLRQELHNDNRTRLIVTHDLNTVTEMDQILVMDQGQIVERGTHHLLLKKGGLYYQLWQTRGENI